MRRWLVVIEDPDSDFENEEALAEALTAAMYAYEVPVNVLRVRRGGLLADKVMEELPPVRHKLMGRPRG